MASSRKGNCWDNAVAESFFATLKNELIHRRSWASRLEVRAALFEYLEIFYHRCRLHSFLDYKTPGTIRTGLCPRGMNACQRNRGNSRDSARTRRNELELELNPAAMRGTSRVPIELAFKAFKLNPLATRGTPRASRR
jgi:putative transposase